MDCSSSEEHHKIIKLLKVVSEKLAKTAGVRRELDLWPREKSPGQEAHGPSKIGAQGVAWESEMMVPKEKHSSAEEMVKLQSALEAETISCLRTRADGPKSTSPEPEKPNKPVFAKPNGFNNVN